jgi:hypothetical protein
MGDFVSWQASLGSRARAPFSKLYVVAGRSAGQLIMLQFTPIKLLGYTTMAERRPQRAPPQVPAHTGLVGPREVILALLPDGGPFRGRLAARGRVWSKMDLPGPGKRPSGRASRRGRGPWAVWRRRSWRPRPGPVTARRRRAVRSGLKGAVLVNLRRSRAGSSWTTTDPAVARTVTQSSAERLSPLQSRPRPPALIVNYRPAWHAQLRLLLTA